MKFLLASNNKDKIREFREVFTPYGVEILSLKDLNINVDPEENGKNFKENAYIKASEVGKLSSLVVIADDSGIEIEALNGFPGIYSARFMEECTYEEKFVALWDMLKDKDNKTCNFNCTLCVVNLEKEPLYFEGKVFGKITTEIKGSAGFGYDPIFFYSEYNKTFAECSAEEKNAASHRGKAIRMFLDYLKENKYLWENIRLFYLI